MNEPLPNRAPSQRQLEQESEDFMGAMAKFQTTGRL